MRFSEGDTFDRYVIESLLGEGGMGEVYQAHDTRLGRKVALKVLRQVSASEGDTWAHAVLRMQREARAVALLSHPSIVAVYDVGEHDGTPFIAMELVHGQSLRELIGAPIPLSDQLSILLDVAQALSAAHQAGIVHRDIKPENIIVRDNRSAKVLDFGIARVDVRKADPHAPTMDGVFITNAAEGAVVGTPAYMSPEQLRGEEIDGRSDQFSWGIVAHELLRGKLPFRTEKGPIGLIASILSDPAPEMLDLPEAVAAIVQRALAKDPEDRFESMEALASSLSSYVAGETSVKMPSSRHMRAKSLSGEAKKAEAQTPPPRRAGRRGLLGVVALLFALALPAIGAWVWRDKEASPGVVAASASAISAPPRATAVTELPIPESTSAEAKIAFREGLQAIRDATWDTAALAFRKALKADPGMAEAHLRFSMLGMWTDMSEAQEAFRKAALQRAQLSPRDRDVLDAFAPIIQSLPSDHATSSKRFEVLAARYPGDAEIAFWHLRTTMRADKSRPGAEHALALAERCVALDPLYADCWQTKENVLLLLARYEEALVALDKCIEVSAGASDCINDKINIYVKLQRCKEAGDVARQWIAKEPASPKPYVRLAEMLYYSDENEASVRIAVSQATKRCEALGWGATAKGLLAVVDAAFGHFEDADRAASSLMSSGGAVEPGLSGTLSNLRLSALVTIGRYEDAVRVGEQRDAELAVLSAPPERHKNWDATVLGYAAKQKTGKLGLSQFEAARDDWLRKQAPTSDEERFLVWRDGFVFPIFAGASAQAALDQEPLLAPLSVDEPGAITPSQKSLRGYVRLAAGKPLEALPFLQSAESFCGGFESALLHTHTLAALGIAREATDDKKGACSAYRRVLSRWGSAKTTPLVKDVMKRAKALACEGIR